MNKAILTVVIVLLSSVSRAQEPTPFKWEKHQEIPARISDVAVGVNLGLDAIHSFRNHQGWNFVCRTGLAVGIPQIVKFVVHRERPNGLDNKSFFSGHEAIGAANAHTPLTMGLAVTIGWGRQAAGMHYGTDVLVGGTVGVLSRYVCK